MAGEETNCEKDVKLRNHFVSNRFYVILVKSDGGDAMKLEKLKIIIKKLENRAQGCEKGGKGCEMEPKAAKRKPKGAKREPKASHREPKASQRRTQMPKQIYARKKVPKRSDQQ